MQRQAPIHLSKIVLMDAISRGGKIKSNQLLTPVGSQKSLDRAGLYLNTIETPSEVQVSGARPYSRLSATIPESAFFGRSLAHSLL